MTLPTIPRGMTVKCMMVDDISSHLTIGTHFIMSFDPLGNYLSIYQPKLVNFKLLLRRFVHK